MPLVGVIANNGKKYFFDEAIQGLNTEELFGLPRDMIFVMARHADHSRGVYSPSTISVTGLLGCLRKTQLERIIPYYQTPDKLWYSLRGTSLHSVLDPGNELGGWLSEMRFHKFTGPPIPECVFCKGSGWIRIAHNRVTLKDEPCGCCSISGQIDGYDATTQTLYDKKSIGDSGLVYIKDGAKQPHILQVNIYKWLLNGGYVHNLSFEDRIKFTKGGGVVLKTQDTLKNKWLQVDLKVRRLVVQYFTMMHVVLTGGELKQKTSFIKTPPNTHVNEINREVLRSYLSGNTEMKLWQLTYKVPEVPILPESDVVSFINAKKQDMVNALQTNTPAPMCDEETQKWLCDFCGVRNICQEMGPLCKDTIDINKYSTKVERHRLAPKGRTRSPNGRNAIRERNIKIKRAKDAMFNLE